MFSDSIRFALVVPARLSQLALIASIFCSSLPSAHAAENLKLLPGISFTQDDGPGFPIVGDKMDDVAIEAGKPTFIFFGAAKNMNTNRQAKRLCHLYKKNAATTKFIVIDVDNPPNEAARQLLRKYYQSYVPAQLLLDANGKQVWSQIGEVQKGKLHAYLTENVQM